MTGRTTFQALPNTAADWRRMGRTARVVLTVPRYAVLALTSAAVVLSVVVVAVNLPVVDLALTGTLPTSARTTMLLRLYPFVGSGFGSLAAILALAVAAVFGVAIAMNTSYWRRRGTQDSSIPASRFGRSLLAIGAGCAACASTLVVGVLSLLGVPWVALVLPFDGLEFALLAVLPLLLSIHWAAEGLSDGRVVDSPGDPPRV